MTEINVKLKQPLSEKLGIFWMLGAMLMFSVTNSFAKLLMFKYTVIQISAADSSLFFIARNINSIFLWVV